MLKITINQKHSIITLLERGHNRAYVCIVDRHLKTTANRSFSTRHPKKLAFSLAKNIESQIISNIERGYNMSNMQKLRIQLLGHIQREQDICNYISAVQEPIKFAKQIGKVNGMLEVLEFVEKVIKNESI